MVNQYSVLLFNAASYNPFFTIFGLLLGAVSIGIGYGAVQLLNGTNASYSSGTRVVGFVAGLLLLGGAVLVLGLAALCAMWVVG
jgi:hypothetical protein